MEAASKGLKEKYLDMVEKFTPKSALGIGCLRAFWVGGLICVLGQAITDIGSELLMLPLDLASTLASVTLIFLTALLTGVGVFDAVGKYAGAGAIVPITGFANAMVSPAMEFRPEGYVLGVGAKLMSLAGAVIVYGVSFSVLTGILYFIIGW